MNIDQTRMKAFWQNPERYRLAYELNIMPKTFPYGLQRGIAFHTIANHVALNTDETILASILRGEHPDTDGRFITGLTPEALTNAVSMWNDLEAHYGQFQVEASEVEFKQPAPRSHFLV
ncbi:MAG: PD-(D/E)XK nuclease family protein, partial [Candidatus Saccharimonadales bacterium]